LAHTCTLGSFLPWCGLWALQEWALWTSNRGDRLLRGPITTTPTWMGKLKGVGFFFYYNVLLWCRTEINIQYYTT
jgi:hypothetical protein